MTKKPKYTEAIHVHRLKLMLKRDNLGNHCPAARKFYGGGSYGEMWATEKSDPDAVRPCRICLSFVGLHEERSYLCPCIILGCKEARKRTEKALKERRK